MAKNQLNITVEKQLREAKKIAEKKAMVERAKAIVSCQPIVGGMRIIDQASEEVLRTLLSIYEGN